MIPNAQTNRGYGTPLAAVARIWTAGCIIRARFLEDVAQAFEQHPAPGLLALAPCFAGELDRRESAWRRGVAAASLAGLPGGWAPGLIRGLSPGARHFAWVEAAPEPGLRPTAEMALTW
jgi:6-phosphogluconate dehydrogenase